MCVNREHDMSRSWVCVFDVCDSSASEKTSSWGGLTSQAGLGEHAMEDAMPCVYVCGSDIERKFKANREVEQVQRV